MSRKKKTSPLLIFLIAMLVSSIALTILTVNFRIYFNKDADPFNTGVYWNWNEFFTTLLGWFVFPLVIAIIWVYWVKSTKNKG